MIKSRPSIVAMILCPIAILLALLSCAPGENEPSPGQASKVNIELSTYYNSTGTISMPTWSNSDRVAVFVAGTHAHEAALATPIQPGRQKSLFVFTLDNISGNTVSLVGYYPSDAEIAFKNGLLETTLPAIQEATVSPFMVGTSSGNVNDILDMKLAQLYTTLYVVVEKGDYSIAELTFSGNNNEGVAGHIKVNPETWAVDASEKKIRVNFSTPLDCRAEARVIPIMVSPGTLSKGYTVTVTDSEGEAFSFTTSESLVLEKGEGVFTDSAAKDDTELIFCGDNMIYIINADLANETSYKDAILWSWDARTVASIVGLSESRMDHVDEAKLVDNDSKLLVTSSYNWTVVLDFKTKEVLFHSVQTPNAHSAELLPNNRLAVANSTGSGTNNNTVQIYDLANSNQVLYQSNLTSAHGVVWNEATQRLYAVGGNTLQIYKLKNWDQPNPMIELEKTVITPQGSLHDLTLVNPNTLCLAGRKAYLYDIAENRFTEMTHFTSSTALKSVNFNDQTNEIWYTDSTNPEGDHTWSTQTIRYVIGKDTPGTTRDIKVPDISMYKVRVKNW